MRLRKCTPLSYSVLLLLAFCAGDVNSVRDGHLVEQHETFDFIVVGGGTAGCAVASRLSESGKYSVLLMEAGGYPPDFLEVPGLAHQNQRNTDVTFQYSSVPQRIAALGVNGGVIQIPLGKVLGGTSQINYSVFNRGSPLDFDNWANITRDSSWKYSNMLPYFRKSEKYLGLFPNEYHRGFKGPIPVSFQHFAPGKEAWFQAGNELGLGVTDPNGPQQISFTTVDVSRKNGRRVSSYEGYIEPVMKSRGNLRILTNAYATEVLFNGDETTAVGIRYNLNGTIPKTGKIVYAKREVILSAGTYGSATLLMRSGIGPRKILKSAGIPQVKELPVGENFQEHPGVPINIILNNKSLSYDQELDLNPANFELWRRFGLGPYADVNGYVGQCFLPSSVAKREGHEDWSDIQMLLAAKNTIRPQFQGNYMAPWETSIEMNLYLGRPKSRGTVRLNPYDILGQPIIDFNHFARREDEDVLLDGIKAVLRIFEGTKTYQRLGARIFSEPLPACRHFHFRSDEYWRCYMKQTTFPGNHPAGTCSMNLVVDSKLRVLGIRKLRVVDAASMPVISNANLHAAVYAIAEKASEDILEDQAENESKNDKNLNYEHYSVTG